MASETSSYVGSDLGLDAPRKADGSAHSDRWLKRQRQIVDAAAGLFAKKGYSATGIAELCDAVGLGKGALYHYIGSKERLLGAIHERVVAQVLRGALSIEQSNISPSLKLRHLGEELVGIITRYPDHVWVFLHEWRALEGEVSQEFKRLRRLYEDCIGRVLTEGVRSGDFRVDNVRLTVMAWLGMHNYTYQWYRSDGGLTGPEIADHFYTTFVSGIKSRRFD